MTSDDSQYWMLLLGSLLAGAAGFLIWRFARSRILYDLHKIPGPVGWPLLGNTMDIIGSKSLHFHQVAAGASNLWRDCNCVESSMQCMLLGTGTQVSAIS